MYSWSELTRKAPEYKKQYPAGTRIVLEQMDNDPRPIPPGTKGTVVHVDDIGTLHCDFDNGRHLGLVPGKDSFRKLTERELKEEQVRKLPLTAQIQSAAQRAGTARITDPAPEKDVNPEY